MRKFKHINKFIIVIVFVAFAVCLLFTVACDNSTPGGMQWHEYKVGDQYSQEQGDFIISCVEASCGITVDETQYDGYYLSVYGEMDVTEFYLKSSGRNYVFYHIDWQNSEDGDDKEYLSINNDLTEALSDTYIYIESCPEGLVTSGNYCIVFDITEDIYNKLYARKDVPTDSSVGYDIELKIDCLGYKYLSSATRAYFEIGAADIDFV